MSNTARETAEYWKKRLTRMQRVNTKEKRDFERLRAKLRDWEDLRDDIVSIAINSGKSEEQIEAEGGPVVRTQRNYKLHVTKQPNLPTLLSYARTCGKELTFKDVSPRVDISTTTKRTNKKSK